MLSSEDEVSVLLQAEEHLLEDVLIWDAVFDESGSCDKVEFAFELIWKRLNIVVRSKIQKLEVRVYFLLLGFIEHAVAAVDASEALIASVAEGLSDKTCSTAEIDDFDVGLLATDVGLELVDDVCDLIRVWVASGLLDCVVVRSKLVEMLSDILLFVGGVLLHLADWLSLQWKRKVKDLNIFLWFGKHDVILWFFKSCSYFN